MRCTPHLFDLASLLFALDPAFLCRPGRLRFFSRLGPLRGQADQPHQTLERVLAVPLLGTELAGFDEEDAVLGDTPACQADEARTHVPGERGGVSYVEAELDSCGHLIHVLPARPRCADEVELHLAVVKRERTRNRDHNDTLHEYPL